MHVGQRLMWVEYALRRAVLKVEKKTTSYSRPQDNLAFITNRTSPATFRALVLVRRLERCVSTAAISLVVMPPAISFKISRSR